MCSLAHSVRGGLGSLGCEVPGRKEGPCSSGPGSFESCWLFLEGPKGNQTGPAGPRQAGSAGARPLADTKLVVSSSYLPLQRQATPGLPSPGWQAFSCAWNCCQPWLQICLSLITSASGTLKRSLLIGCK